VDAIWKTGWRFKMARATVLLTGDGKPRGPAAMFDRRDFL